MKILKAAIAIAEQKKENDKHLHRLQNYIVCPKCGGDLEAGFFPAYAYECNKCTFCFTSAQEAELEKRMEHAK